MTAAILLALALASAPAGGGEDVAKAAKAYRQAQQAELSEEFALASDLYELADQLAPSAEALRGATRMALSAERWGVAAEHAAALKRRYPDDKKSLELAEQTLERTRPLLNEVTVDCGGVDCTVLVDGKAARLEPQAKHVLFVTAGEHRLAGGYPSGPSQEIAITAEAGGASQVAFTPPVVKSSAAPPPTTAPEKTRESDRAPADEKPRPRKSRARLSPWFFGIGTVATLGLAAGTTVSGLQARAAGKDFDEGGRTRELYDEANALEIQTNVLFGVTAAVGVTTIVFAIFTDWKRASKNRERKRKATARLSSGPTWAGTGFVVDF
jgi:hypothetical protein